jgi:hypothetical protein
MYTSDMHSFFLIEEKKRERKHSQKDNSEMYHLYDDISRYTMCKFILQKIKFYRVRLHAVYVFFCVVNFQSVINGIDAMNSIYTKPKKK